MDYAKVYQVYKSLSWLDDPFGLFIKLHLENKFDPLFKADLDELHRQVYPRRKKINHQNLPEDLLQPIRDKWQRIALAYLDAKVRQKILLRNMLYKLSVSVDMTPQAEMQVIKHCDQSTYSSQGFGAARYARASLESDLQLLQEAEFTARIEKKCQWLLICERENCPNPDTDWCSKSSIRFNLVANATKWQLDALQRRDKKSLLEWAVDCWGRGTNPKVFSPFLPQDVFDKSMDIHMKRGA